MSYSVNTQRSEVPEKLSKMLLTKDEAFNRQPESNKFFQFEPAVVLDVIWNKDHELFSDPKLCPYVDPNEWPENAEGGKHSIDDIDYSWVGRAKVRLCYSEAKVPNEQLNWAIPWDTNFTVWPLVNEIVMVVKIFDSYYYTHNVSTRNFLNNNCDFRYEYKYGGTFLSAYGKKIEAEKKSDPDYHGAIEDPRQWDKRYPGPLSKTRADGGPQHEGAMGHYFSANSRIRPIVRHEGDLVIESRFGQSIKFGGYDGERGNDSGFSQNTDYYSPKESTSPLSLQNGGTGKSGAGNPQIMFRNRQRQLSPKEEIEGKQNGFIYEDVNEDGSSFQFTSGVTESKYKTTCKKKWLQEGLGEVPLFAPKGSTPFKFPKLTQDQLVLNSDRLLFSSKRYQTFMFSKQRFQIVTDDEFTVDSHKQQVFTSNTKTVFNSPFIYLGQYNETKEPVLLGQTTIEWLYDLCEWIRFHTHFDPNINTSTPVEIGSLVALQQRLPSLLSKRVFVTGGGYAPGQDGGKIQGGTPPGKLPNVPGGFYGDVPRIKNGKGQEGSSGGTSTIDGVKEKDALPDDEKLPAGSGQQSKPEEGQTPSAESEGGNKTSEVNPDGSITTTETQRNEDGSVSVTKNTYKDGSVTNTTTETMTADQALENGTGIPIDKDNTSAPVADTPSTDTPIDSSDVGTPRETNPDKLPTSGPIDADKELPLPGTSKPNTSTTSLPNTNDYGATIAPSDALNRNVRTDSGITASELDNHFLQGGLKGLGQTYVDAGKKYGIDPAFLAAVSMHETGKGTSNPLLKGNNAMGISDNSGPIYYNSSGPAASIYRQASSMTRPGGYYTNNPKTGTAYTPGDFGGIYAPTQGYVSNDPRNLNRYWPGGVSRYYSQALNARGANSPIKQ